mgnify:CR=1 FL=1
MVKEYSIYWKTPYQGVYHKAPITFTNLVNDGYLADDIIMNLAKNLERMEVTNSYYMLQHIHILYNSKEEMQITLFWVKRPKPAYPQDSILDPSLPKLQNIFNQSILRTEINVLDDYTSDFRIRPTGAMDITELIGDMELPQKFTLGLRIFLN